MGIIWQYSGDVYDESPVRRPPRHARRPRWQARGEQAASAAVRLALVLLARITPAFQAARSIFGGEAARSPAPAPGSGQLPGGTGLR
jgi:hypothetical protein